MKRVMVEMALGVLAVVGAVCIVLVGISVIDDMSDGKVDGVKYANGCDR